MLKVSILSEKDNKYINMRLFLILYCKNAIKCV